MKPVVEEPPSSIRFMRKISKDEIIAALGRLPEESSDESTMVDGSDTASTVDLEEYSIMDVEDNPDIVDVIKIAVSEHSAHSEKPRSEKAHSEKEVIDVAEEAVDVAEEAVDVVAYVNEDDYVLVEDIIDDISEIDMTEELAEAYKAEDFSEDDDEFIDTVSHYSMPRPTTSISIQTFALLQLNVDTQTAPKEDAEIQTDKLPVRKYSKFRRFLKKCMESFL